VVQHIVEFMNALPPLPLLALYSVLVGPVLVVLHELGHAMVALWRSDGSVVVRLGARRRVFAIRSGRFQLEADQLAHCGGVCLVEENGLSRVDLAAISLAGPLATLLAGTATAVLWAHTGGVLQDALAVATFEGFLLGIINVLPLTYRADKSSPALRLDGLLALQALRGELLAPRPAAAAHDVKAGPVAERWAVEVEEAAERARLQRKRANLTRLRARDDERRTRSIPPPGF
jgi:hypothetical protein